MSEEAKERQRVAREKREAQRAKQSFRNRLFRVTFIFAMTSLPGALWPCKEAQEGV